LSASRDGEIEASAQVVRRGHRTGEHSVPS
jgi:hypothetical protein